MARKHMTISDKEWKLHPHFFLFSLSSFLRVFVQVVMTLVSIPLMDKTGRRTLHLYGLGGMFIFSIFITISFLIKASKSASNASFWTMMRFIDTFKLNYVLFYCICAHHNNYDWKCLLVKKCESLSLLHHEHIFYAYHRGSKNSRRCNKDVEFLMSIFFMCWFWQWKVLFSSLENFHYNF